MSRKIIVNLPVKDLEKSKTFFSQIGFNFNPQMSNHEAACVAISEEIYVMVMTHDKFKGFALKAIADSATAEAILCITCESRAEVDQIVAKAVAAGATTVEEPTDYGFMYSHSFADVDGHLWNWVWMDPSSIQK